MYKRLNSAVRALASTGSRDFNSAAMESFYEHNKKQSFFFTRQIIEKREEIDKNVWKGSI